MLILIGTEPVEIDVKQMALLRLGSAHNVIAEFIVHHVVNQHIHLFRLALLTLQMGTEHALEIVSSVARVDFAVLLFVEAFEEHLVHFEYPVFIVHIDHTAALMVNHVYVDIRMVYDGLLVERDFGVNIMV